MDRTVLYRTTGITAAAVLAAAVFGFFFVRNANVFSSPDTYEHLLFWGRFAGLLAGLIFLYQLLSNGGKNRTLAKFFPAPKLGKLHRFLGYAVLLALGAHVGLIFAGRSLWFEEPFLTPLKKFLFDGSWGSLAAIGFVFLAVALIFSALFSFRILKYPKWHPTHYLVYPALLCLFFHQIFFGLDFQKSAGFRIFWIAVFVLACIDIVIWHLRGKKAK